MWQNYRTCQFTPLLLPLLPWWYFSTTCFSFIQATCVSASLCILIIHVSDEPETDPSAVQYLCQQTSFVEVINELIPIYF